MLLVEDDPAVATFIASALRKADYNVLDASGSEQALDIVSAHAAPIHLLLTDVVMSGMNGRELSDRVTAKRGETRVLFMSGHSDDAILRHGIETASANFIQKPFSIDALATRIRQTLANPLPGRRRL